MVSENDKQFTTELSETFCKTFAIKHQKYPLFSKIEWANRTLRQYIQIDFKNI